MYAVRMVLVLKWRHHGDACKGDDMAVYGAETLSERYRLSFTVGGLLAAQGQSVASVLMEEMTEAEAADAFPSESLLERTRSRAVETNVLAIRTRAANVRMVREVVKRLSALTTGELRYVADAGTPLPDCCALMWVAMCRYYALVGEFAAEVLRDRYLLGALTVTHEDYDRFMLGKSMWHPELEKLSPSTVAKLRSNVFRAMAEAGLLQQPGDTIVPALLSCGVTGILDKRPDSFGYFPMRG